MAGVWTLLAAAMTGRWTPPGRSYSMAGVWTLLAAPNRSATWRAVGLLARGWGGL